MSAKGRGDSEQAPFASERAEYAKWYADAVAADKRSGARRWRETDSSSSFDYAVVRERLEELRCIAQRGDAESLMYYFDEGMHGNMAGIGAPSLYRRAKAGTKTLISDYLGALDESLEQLCFCDETEISRERKLRFFRRARRAFGRCGLMLSGAGSLGPFHLGVAQALASQDLVPKVISGSSAGSLVAAVLCSHRDTSVLSALTTDSGSDSFSDVSDDATSAAAGRLREDALRALIDRWIPDLTFADAKERSGRSLNVSVAPARLHQQSRTLNEITSPNVFIREAVLASCAVPGVFPPVALMARSASGKRVPYVRSRSWVDGSVTNDLPMKRLMRVHGCNFFIASQTNPVVRWAISDPNNRNLLTDWLSLYRTGMKQIARETYSSAMRITRPVAPLNAATRVWYSIITQDYTADVNILPRERFWNPATLLAPLTSAGIETLIANGRSATWSHIERIRNCTVISRRVDASIETLSGA